MFLSIRSFQLAVLVLCFFLSCHSAKQTPTNTDATQTGADTKQATTTPQQPLPTTSCDAVIKNFPNLKLISSTPEGVFQISTESNLVVDEASFVKWLGALADETFRAGCSYSKLAVSTTLAAGYYLEATLLRSDYDLFKQGKITEAEWHRRFDVKRVETTAYLLQSLKEARAKADHVLSLTLIDRILEKEPQNQTVLLIKANVLLEQKLCADAILLYTNVLASQPDHPAALFNLGVAQKELGSFGEAVTTFERLLSLLPTKAGSLQSFSQEALLLQLVDAALKNNDLERSGRYLAQIKEVTSIEYSVLKAQFLRMQGLYGEAKDVLQGLANRPGVPPYVLFDLTLAYLDLKDVVSAKAAFEKLKTVDASMVRELEFLQPFRGAETPVVPDPTVTPPANSQVSVPEKEDMDYSEQPAETEDEEKKF